MSFRIGLPSLIAASIAIAASRHAAVGLFC